MDGKQIKKKKTNISTTSDRRNPVWNEAITFPLKRPNIHNVSLEIFVSVPGEATVVGTCGIGPHESGNGLFHYHDLILNVHPAALLWHELR